MNNSYPTLLISKRAVCIEDQVPRPFQERENRMPAPCESRRVTVCGKSQGQQQSVHVQVHCPNQESNALSTPRDTVQASYGNLNHPKTHQENLTDLQCKKKKIDAFPIFHAPAITSSPLVSSHPIRDPYTPPTEDTFTRSHRSPRSTRSSMQDGSSTWNMYFLQRAPKMTLRNALPEKKAKLEALANIDYITFKSDHERRKLTPKESCETDWERISIPDHQDKWELISEMDDLAADEEWVTDFE